MSTPMPDELPRAIHPGEALREDFLAELGITPEKLANLTGIPLPHIEDLLAEEISFSVEDAVRISDALDITPAFWLDLQASYTRWEMYANGAVAN